LRAAQFHFRYNASCSLVEENSQAKLDPDITQSFDLVFSSDRSVYEFQADQAAPCVVGSFTVGYDWNDRFTDKPVSATTGLYYDYPRWYDPSIGRFITQDPLPGYASDPQSHNPYVYVENTPTSLVDPTGAYDEP